jgi:predicted glycoside hydrolase/deacetylase ChbG (UPF0249 family)
VFTTRTAHRFAAIVADDYGIGPETSRGILDLANDGIITATVLIVNTPDAERATGAWFNANPNADFGWHPNLTLDRPLSKPEDIPSLVQPDGTFWPLAKLLKRLLFRQIAFDDVQKEWTAQLTRFIELTGRAPDLVNSHQHVSLFSPCRAALFKVLQARNLRPYMRRVIEPQQTLMRVPGARLKRTVLTLFGRRSARHGGELPGCDWLLGVTDHSSVNDERFWERRFRHLGQRGNVEVCCHPGYRDVTLVGRDCAVGDGLERRPRETQLLRLPTFHDSLNEAGFRPVRPTQVRSNTWTRC